MKIGYDAKRYFNNTTGLGNYARWLIDGIASRENVDSVLFHTKPVQHPSLNVISTSGIWTKLGGLWRAKFICSAIAASGVDIYHGLSNELPFGIHRLGIKTVVTIHDLINLRYPEHYGFIDRIIYKAKLNYAIKYANLIITPSSQTKEDIVHFFKHTKKNITVIPLSILGKTTASTNKQPFCKPYILCVSSFTKRKNLPLLIQAFTTLQDKNVNLVIAGKKGETYQEALSLANKTENVSLKTDVSNQELDALYRQSLFCVYPSLFEGFGIPILEAFRYGKTIATSNISSMPEVGGEAALYFDPACESEIADALHTLLQTEKREEFVVKINERLVTFSSPKLISDYQLAYENMLEQ